MTDFNHYLITIKNTSDELVFKSKKADDTSTYYTKLEVENNKKAWTITVKGINYVKEIYRPCQLTLNLEISMSKQTDTLVSFGELTRAFTNAEVTINAKRGTGSEVTIISNYYINSVQPSLQPNKSYKVKLEACSADYQLKIDNFSECYLNTSLKSIIEKQNKALSKEKYQIHPIKFSCDVQNGLQNINYKTLNGDYQVYHTPYAVQYNESFYDFIARLAHRYGEFLFFENGSLHLGVDPILIQKTHNLDSTTTVEGTTQTTTNYYKSITQTNIPDSMLGTFVNGSHYDYHNPDSLDQSQEYNYDLDYAEDMYMESLEMNDLSDQSYEVLYEEKKKKEEKKTHSEKYVDWTMFMGWLGLSRKFLTFITSCRREDGFSWKECNDTYGAFAKLAIAWADAYFGAKGKVDKTNSNYKKFYGDLKSGSYDANEQESEGKMRPFATYLLNESFLTTQHNSAQENYTKAEATRKSREAEVDQQKLGNALTAFENMITKAKTLKQKLSDYKEKVTTKKDELTPLITKLDEIILSASTTTHEFKVDDKTYKYTCKGIITEVNTELTANIENRKKNQKEESTFKANVTDNKVKDEDAVRYEKRIDEILAVIALFEKSFLNKDNKDYLSEACKLAGFCDVKDDELTSPEDPKAADRKSFALTIQNDYVKLKAELKDAKEKITSTRDHLDSMLKNAYYVENAIAAENEAYKKLLGLSLKITQGNLFHKFLESVEKAEISSAKKRMSMEIDTSNYSEIPLLGQTIEFDSLKYLIIGVKSDYTWDTTQSAFTENLILDVTPQNQTTFDDLDGMENVNQWIPPLSECRKMPKVGAMIATVTDNKDPRGMGRLRIKYKWQNKDSAKTPWIRMSTPFASKYGAGMFFYPQKDDEVLVDFYNGNIDRPIIVGVLRNEKTDRDYVTAYGVGGWHKRNDIANLAGQMIQFKDGFMTFSDLVKYLPGLGSVFAAYNPDILGKLNWIQNAMQGGKDEDVRDTEWQKYMRGSILMHDRYNTWEISGSTTDRKINIASNLGSVSIDALSGITISAPLGDLTISAKNIKMQASNNILIESGTQISRQRKIKNSKRSGMEMFYDATKDALKDKTTVLKVDLSMVRLVMEAIIPPVEGTLLVKSNRYLKLEAGENGSAEDFKNPFKMGQRSDAKKWIKGLFSHKSDVKDLRKFVEEHAEDFEMMNKALNAIPEKVKSVCQSRLEARKNFMEAFNAVKNYKLNNDNVTFQNFDNANFWQLDTTTEDAIDALQPDSINNEIIKVINVEADAVDGLFECNNDKKLKKALQSVGLAYNKNEQVDNQKDAYSVANKKKFLKLAVHAAHLAKALSEEAANVLIDAWTSQLLEAMGYNAATIIHTYTLNEQREIVNDAEVNFANMEGAIKTLYTSLLGQKDADVKIGDNLRTAAVPVPTKRLEDKTFVNSIVRAFLCKVISLTGCYVYKQGYAEEKLNAVKTIGQIIPNPAAKFSMAVKVPKNADIAAMITNSAADITYFAVLAANATDSLDQRNNNWQMFTKSCKFITDFWANPPRTQTGQGFANTLGTLVEEASDLSGLSTILNDLAGIIGGSIIESASVKSATHGGRVLISDNGVTAGLNSNGTFERTSAKKVGSKKWK